MADYFTALNPPRRGGKAKYKTEEERKEAIRLRTRERQRKWYHTKKEQNTQQLIFGRSCCQLLEKVQNGEIDDIDLLIEQFKQLKMDMEATRSKIKFGD